MAPSFVWALAGEPYRRKRPVERRPGEGGPVERRLEDGGVETMTRGRAAEDRPRGLGAAPAHGRDVEVAVDRLTDLDEAGLVAACLAGRADAFEVIVERHRRSVYLLCYRFVGNHEDARDLSQDVFLRAYRGLGKFRGGSSLATWLYRIGVNLCLNRASVKRPVTEGIDERQHIDTRSESASERVLREERGTQVRKAIAALPPKQRATLILRMYHELSHEQIAGVLGSSVGAVKANFFHALGNLRKQLGKESI